MKLLEIEHLKKGFDELDVLHDISMSVEEGEVVAIIGPSGSGKSTLLRCATLLERMDMGTLQYLGEYAARADGEGRAVYAGNADLKRIQGYFGLVFQNFNLFPHYTVLKNLMDAPVHIQKRNKEAVKQEALALLEKMGLSDKADSYPCQLSGGQQQRVAIARALALHPSILFFDEPTSALDPELTGEILKVIRQLAAEKMTMVIVTHEMAFARDVADRVIFMDGGYIVEEGMPGEVIGNPKEERTRQFLSRFAENSAAGTR
ncbi:MAG: amino acid ABC transporter ATP-binding protein [Lachnospiraceae bacterium]|nr:amino acid ABC transporter ATP-binding protein [Lachnospiraceae bacterium]MDE7435223.1 amino acid ABC transporter ATP-binding protein [Lachnospiraceae bacterium]